MFAISWGGVLIMAGPGGIPATDREQVDKLLPIAILAMVAGPSVAGILLTGLLHGRAGLREFGSRLLRWRVGARWYAMALLAAPLLFAAIILALSLFSPEFLPGILVSDDKASVLLMGITAGLTAGIFEEIGWTGFAIPTLLGRMRYSVLSTGLIVGVLWGAWHLIRNDIWASVATSGDLPLALFVTLRGVSLLVGQLLAYRVLMVWVYDRTGSLLLAILMHASFAACTFILGPLVGPGAMSGTSLLAYDFALAAVLWVVVGVVAVATHGHLTRQPPHRRRVA